MLPTHQRFFLYMKRRFKTKSNKNTLFRVYKLFQIKIVCILQVVILPNNIQDALVIEFICLKYYSLL